MKLNNFKIFWEIFQKIFYKIAIIKNHKNILPDNIEIFSIFKIILKF
jgi:hypothetical protein